MNENHVTIGVAGHTDHGKTSLVRCLTSVDTDFCNNEKQPGVSIESEITAHDLASGKQIAFIDIPGHSAYLKNAIRGLSAVDMIILVVAADDGIMPQTLEHLNLLKYLKIKYGMIVLSKSDLVDKELLEMAELEIRDEIKKTFLFDKPIIPFSAVNGNGKEKIFKEIEKEIEKIKGKDKDAFFRLWIDKVCGFSGFGTVACGTILSGSVSQDDLLYLAPSFHKTKARSLEVHGKRKSKAVAGQRVGINLPKIPLKKIDRGMALLKSDSIDITCFLNVEIKVCKTLKNRQRVRLYLGTLVSSATVVLMQKQRLEPGEAGLAQLRVKSPLPAIPNDNFIICPLNSHTAIGGGTVIQTTQKKYRSAKKFEILPYLKAAQQGNLDDIITCYFKSNPGKLITDEKISRHSGFPLPKIRQKITIMIKKRKIIAFSENRFFLKELYLEMLTKIPNIIKNILSQSSLLQSVNKEEIRKQFNPVLDDSLFQILLFDLCEKKKLIKYKSGFVVPEFLARLYKSRDNLIEILTGYAKKSGLSPFTSGGFCRNRNHNFNKYEISKILNYLADQGKLIRLNNDSFISAAAIENIKVLVKSTISKKGNICITDTKSVFGYGRSKGAPVLEYMDEIGLTLRQGNKRTLKTNPTVG